jgi:hypothetical protein
MWNNENLNNLFACVTKRTFNLFEKFDAFGNPDGSLLALREVSYVVCPPPSHSSGKC